MDWVNLAAHGAIVLFRRRALRYHGRNCLARQQAQMHNAPDIDFNKLTVLVIDDHPGMRASLRITLSNFGVTKTDMCQGAFDAVHRIKQRGYDVIVCDYNLGEGRDGQQLLEELRHTGLISLATVFLMVTAHDRRILGAFRPNTWTLAAGWMTALVMGLAAAALLITVV